MTVAVASAFRSWVPLAAIQADLDLPEDDHGPLLLDETAPALALLELGPAELRLVKRLASGERVDSLLASGAPREPVVRLAGALRAVGLWR